MTNDKTCVILDKPYLSKLLLNMLSVSKAPVYINDPELIGHASGLNVISREELQKYDSFYAVSEDSITLILEVLNGSQNAINAKEMKDKFCFRKKVASLYPELFFKKVSVNELENFNAATLPFPVVVKPVFGICSMGVHIIEHYQDWKAFCGKIKKENMEIKKMFSADIVNTEDFIIESYIEGEEYAVDAYFDDDGMPSILNILRHPFAGKRDVSDRVYYTSKQIVAENYELFLGELKKLGGVFALKDFPVHVEYRVSNGRAIPIEANPFRFTGWCCTDIAYYAFGIDPHEHFVLKKKPDWPRILAEASNDNFCINCAEVPCDVDVKKIKKINFDEFSKLFSGLIELWRLDLNYSHTFAIAFSRTGGSAEINDFLVHDFGRYIEM